MTNFTPSLGNGIALTQSICISINYFTERLGINDFHLRVLCSNKFTKILLEDFIKILFWVFFLLFLWYSLHRLIDILSIAPCLTHSTEETLMFSYLLHYPFISYW